MSSRRFYVGLTLGLGSGYLFFTFDRSAAIERVLKKDLDVISNMTNINGKEIAALIEEVKKKKSERLILSDAWKSKLIQVSKTNPGYEVRRNKALQLNEYISLFVKNEIKLIDARLGWFKDHMQQQENNTNEAERDFMIDSSSSNEI